MSKIWDSILKSIYPIHTLGSLDEYWLYDDKDSLSNASILITTNRCKYEHVYDFVYNKFCQQIPKTKCKLIEIFGRWYWIEMD